MGISFHAGCYFLPQKKREDVFSVVFQCCQKNGFDYLETTRDQKTFEKQLIDIVAGVKHSFWISGYGGQVLVSVGDKPELFGFPVDNKVALLHFIFDYYFITTDNEAHNQRFLEKFVALQTELYLMLNAELGWGGYPADIPKYKEYVSGKIKTLYWFNLFSLRFVEKTGRKKLLGAPGWEIKELPDKSVIVRLSDHPHHYEKIDGVYLHKFLGIDAIDFTE